MAARINGLVVLADVPELSDERKPQSRITVARMGTYKDARYGTFQIDKTDFTGWQKNLAETFGNRIAVDFDHSSDRGRGTEAAAWIVGLERQGKDLVADVKWTPRGARAVRDGAYAYFSPTYVNNYKDERGQDRGRALIGGALTNRPVLRDLPTLSLSRDEFEGVALAHSAGKSPKKGAGKKTAARDSRALMAPLSEVAKLLGLDENADLATVVAGVVTLEAASPPSPSRTPGAKASSRPTRSGGTAGNPPDSDAGASKKAKKGKKNKQVAMSLSKLDEESFAQLLLDANAGASAASQLAEQTFTHAWEKALSEGRAAPSQEQNLRELHAQNPELAIKTLDSFVRIVPTTPAGSSGATPGSPDGPAPSGEGWAMDTDRFSLHTQAKALAAEKRREDPKLPEDEAYTLAVFEIQERQFELANPGI